MARPFLAPPGVPADRVAALRKAFWATATDADYMAQANKLGLEIDSADWQEMMANIQSLYATPEEVVAVAKKLIRHGKL
jgi:tripartite-type tricarboxylate transporter receptor subunit TctC